MLARDTPLAREMQARLGDSPNILLYATTRDLVEILVHRPPRWVPPGAAGGRGWDGSVDEIAALLGELAAAPPAFAALRQRLGDLAGAAQPAHAPPDPEAGLSVAMRRLRSWMIRHPALRRAVQPAWRLLWRLTR